MKIKYSILALFLISSALIAADVNWIGPITFIPANPAVGDNVTIKAAFSVLNDDVRNLNVTCKIDGKVVYTKMFPKIEDPKTTIIPINWTAAHSSLTPHLQGQPSNVKVVFSFSSKTLITTNGNSIETIILVKDAAPTIGTRQIIEQKKPDLQLTPCMENANGTTDLVPVEFSFKYDKFGKFFYKVGIKNTGPKCVKKLGYKIVYPVNGVETLYNEYNLPANQHGWVLEAGQTRYINGTFDRHNLPYQVFETYIDSEVQEITFTLVGLKLVIDSHMDVTETNESNNTIETSLHWVEK